MTDSTQDSNPVKTHNGHSTFITFKRRSNDVQIMSYVNRDTWGG